jgi:hypothetical protein
MLPESSALVFDGSPPTVGTPVFLHLPFQQMHQQDFQAAFQGSLLAFPHILNLFRQVLNINFRPPPGTNQGGLLPSPCKKVSVVVMCSHANDLEITQVRGASFNVTVKKWLPCPPRGSADTRPAIPRP